MAACTRAPASERDKFFIVLVVKLLANAICCCCCYTAPHAEQLPTSDPEIQHAGTNRHRGQKPSSHTTDCRNSKLFHPPLGSTVFACMLMVKKTTRCSLQCHRPRKEIPLKAVSQTKARLRGIDRVHPTHVKSLTKLNDSVLQ